MKLTIDRNKWMRGEGSSKLLDTKSGKMCCIGFYSLACGLRDADINDIGSPSAIVDPPFNWSGNIKDEQSHGEPLLVRRSLPKCMTWLVARQLSQLIVSSDGRSLMLANDQPGDDASRETGIRDIFARNGVEVRFVNSAP